MSSTVQEVLLKVTIDETGAISGLEGLTAATQKAHANAKAQAQSGTADLKTEYDKRLKVINQHDAEVTAYVKSFSTKYKATLDDDEQHYVASMKRRSIAFEELAKKSEGQGAKGADSYIKYASMKGKVDDELEHKGEELAKREISRQHQLRETAISVANQVARSGGRAALEGTGIPMPSLAGGVALGAGVAAAVAVTEIKKSTEAYIEQGEAVNKLKIETGASAQAASTQIEVAKRFGVSSQDLLQIQNRLKQEMVQQPQLFKELGISLTDAGGKTRSVSDVFADLRAKLAGSAQDSNTMQVASTMLGRSAYDMLPYLTEAQSGIDKITQEVQKGSSVMSEAGVAEAKRYSQEMRGLAASFDDARRNVGHFFLDLLSGAGQAKNALGDIKLPGFGFQAPKTLDEMFNPKQETRNGVTRKFGQSWAAAGNIPADERENAQHQRSENLENTSGANDQEAKSLAAIAQRNRLHQIVMDDLAEEQRGFDRGFQLEMRGIEDTERAYSRTHQDRMLGDSAVQRQIQRGYQDEDLAIQLNTLKRNRAFEDRMRQIQLEQQADSWIQTQKQRARDDELRGLDLAQQAAEHNFSVEQANWNLQQLQREFNRTGFVQVYRMRGESEEQYNEKVASNEEKLRNLTHSLASDKQRIALDTNAWEISQRKIALDTIARNENRALEDKRHLNELEINDLTKQKLTTDRLEQDSATKRQTDRTAQARRHEDQLVEWDAENTKHARVIEDETTRLSRFQQDMDYNFSLHARNIQREFDGLPALIQPDIDKINALLNTIRYGGLGYSGNSWQTAGPAGSDKAMGGYNTTNNNSFLITMLLDPNSSPQAIVEELIREIGNKTQTRFIP